MTGTLFNADAFHDSVSQSPLADWSEALAHAVRERSEQLRHGDMPAWQAAFDSLPELSPRRIDPEHEDGVSVLAPDVSQQTAQQLEQALRAFIPWRKGPYRIGPVHINTEWRSDWKWNRVLPHISPLNDRCVLDVGCGSGYHLWRMRATGASCVLGIDPGVLFTMQCRVLQRYMNDPAVNMLPLPLEAMPANMHLFDTVFSMGVLYHRRDPHAHLLALHQCLRNGGELVLETLVSLGEEESELAIDGRYARMRNIWSLPSVPLLARWLGDAGFGNIRCVSVDITSVLEQRSTDWMPFESLQQSLDDKERALTVEGLPRPRRAVMIAET